MKFTTVLGSPRKKGNTNRVLSWIEETVSATGHQIDRVNLTDHTVRSCKGCHTCKRHSDRIGCPQGDDGVRLLENTLSSAAIVYATPNYFWGPSSQLKAFIDRHCSLVTGFGTDEWLSLLTGKSLAAVITCEDQIEDNCDLLMELFPRFAHYLKCTYAGALIIPFTTKPDDMGEDIREQAHRFAAGLLHSAGNQNEPKLIVDR